MDFELQLPMRLVLVDPPAGIDYGVQKGSGANYKAASVQQRERREVSFDFTLEVRNNREDGLPNFLGPFAQGPPTDRFVYIDVGSYAGQKDTPWARRMKVPLDAITWPHIKKAVKKGRTLQGRIPGKDKDGGPNCATVRLIGDWEVVRLDGAIDAKPKAPTPTTPNPKATNPKARKKTAKPAKAKKKTRALSFPRAARPARSR